MNHFISLSQLAIVEALPGAYLASLQTENLTVAHTDMKAGAEIPLHHHPEEAIDIILEGILEMQVVEKTDTLSQEMISIVPSNIKHQAKALTDCKVVTIFYLQRKL
jgi:quercetin dioxygenase-like cupin family protein